MKRLLFFFSFLIWIVLPLDAQQVAAAPIPSISQKTAGMQRIPGYFTMYWDKASGALWLEIARWDDEFLLVDSLPEGVGSNDLGLDRGQLGDNKVVRFERIGPKVLLIQPNYGYRASSKDPQETRAVEESFAQSVLWGFTVGAEEDSRVLVDATDFFLSDIHRVADTIRQLDQGNFRLEPTRSAIYLPRTKSFPNNTEIESTLTFVGDNPGGFVRQVVPTPQDITVREHFSFVQLPDGRYEPREFDPRCGYSDIEFHDYSAPIGESLNKRYMIRHRLVKKDTTAAVSEPVKPIIYYLDPATPEPVRSALLEGASWWEKAFEAIGFTNAFQVKLLPPDADPMDVRYNVIQWVHRATRGWSFGGAVVDPRTGEIIQGHVTLGSLRVRQDYLIATGLLNPFAPGTSISPEAREMALARLRQLSAHEVGHSLGLAHNFAASTRERASVMDYPQPLVKIREDGSLDLSDAYATGVGEWDKVTIAYGYSEFSQDNERDQLNHLLQDAASRDLYFVTDGDARPAWGAHPSAHLWDNGPDAVGELGHILAVRSAALARFSEQSVPEGAPMATLEDVLVPIYLYHRYQIQAAAKLLGGMDYRYALRGDNQEVTNTVESSEQRRALDELLRTLSPEVLALPERVLRMIPPRPPGYDRDRELFHVRTGLTFDPLAAAETAASMTVNMILQPERDARLVEYHARDNRHPGLQEVVDRLLKSTWQSPHGAGYAAEIRRTVDHVVLNYLLQLAADEEAEPQVRAIANLKLEELRQWLSRQLAVTKDEDLKAHYFFAANRIKNFLANPQIPFKTHTIDWPEGPPIGSSDDE